jgi:hypothetical protein
MSVGSKTQGIVKYDTYSSYHIFDLAASLGKTTLNCEKQEESRFLRLDRDKSC